MWWGSAAGFFPLPVLPLCSISSFHSLRGSQPHPGRLSHAVRGHFNPTPWPTHSACVSFSERADCVLFPLHFLQNTNFNPFPVALSGMALPKRVRFCKSEWGQRMCITSWFLALPGNLSDIYLYSRPLFPPTCTTVLTLTPEGHHVDKG